MSSFWHRLKTPFLVQAPMDDVADTVFRQIIAKCAPPDVFFTEFTCVDALCSAGRNKALQKLKFTEEERPIVAQVWGTEPNYFYESAKLINSLGFDGIDINLGCPDKAVLKKGAGGALISEPSKVALIVKAAKEGAPGLAMSVKTRLGIEKPQVEEWLGFLLTLPIDALTVHLRTIQELSKAPAHWDKMRDITAIRNKLQSPVVLIGNGDIKSRAEAIAKAKEYGIEGVMIGRGTLNNFWVFNPTAYAPTYPKKLNLLIDHLQLYDKTWGKVKNFNNLKKFYKYYLSGQPASKQLRLKLMAVTTIEETIREVRPYTRCDLS